MSSINLLTVQDSPYLIVIIECDNNYIKNLKYDCSSEWLISILDPEGNHNLDTSIFRGVELDHLSQVISKGVDVTPSQAPIFAGRLDKAFEYGGVPKIISAYDSSQLDKSYREVSIHAELHELSNLMKVFPTAIPSDDGEMLWLTKFAYDDPRAATSYEAEYGKWIPGSPFDALRAIIVFTDALASVTKALHLNIASNSILNS